MEFIELAGVFENPEAPFAISLYMMFYSSPEICSREASYDDHSSRGQSQYNHELDQFSEGPSDLRHREQ